MFKDYYAILEIPKSASLSEIKTAFRAKALRWHPDKNQGEDTTEKMKDINEAKLILTDKEARARYDREYSIYKSYIEEQDKTNKASTVYKFEDDILEKWMKNARKQAIQIVNELLYELKRSSLIGFKTFFKLALQGLFLPLMIAILFLIINELSK